MIIYSYTEARERFAALLERALMKAKSKSGAEMGEYSSSGLSHPSASHPLTCEALTCQLLSVIFSKPFEKAARDIRKIRGKNPRPNLPVTNSSVALTFGIQLCNEPDHGARTNRLSFTGPSTNNSV